MMQLVDRCPNARCGQSVVYDEGMPKVRCKNCGWEGQPVELLSKRQELLDAKKKNDAYEKALEKSKARQVELLTKLEDTKEKINELEAVQQQGQERLSRLLSAVMNTQTDADRKLELLYQTTQLLNARAEEQAAAQIKMHTRLISLGLQTEESMHIMQEFKQWVKEAREEDRQELLAIHARSEELLKDRQACQADLIVVREKIESIGSDLQEVKMLCNDIRLTQLNAAKVKYDQAVDAQTARRFDEAIQLYKATNAAAEEADRDPEIRWRIIMCIYGIEYHKSGEIMYPIIHRPILDPEATRMERRHLIERCEGREDALALYQERLKEIDRILQEYAELMGRQDWDYQVFLCVKQKDNNEKTDDSRVAMDLYRKIKKLGLKVFNSEAPECKATYNREWEPRILAALMRSKVLIVVGSCKEYFEAPWVRTEWSRYKWLMDREKATGHTDRLIIPYRIKGMNHRDIPQELQTMKQLPDSEGAERVELLEKTLRAVFKIPEDPNVLKLKRVYNTELQYGMFDQARKTCDELQGVFAADDRRTGYMWLAMMMADLKVRRIEDLRNLSQSFAGNGYYREAIKSLDADMRAKLEEILRHLSGDDSPPVDPLQQAIDALQSMGIAAVKTGKGIRVNDGRQCAQANVELPEQVTEIAAGAFENNRAIRSVKLPEGVREIPENAFRFCENLRSVTLPGKLESIGAGAFNGCTLLDSVTLPQGLRSIGCCAFFHCVMLERMTIPSTVKQIDWAAFGLCEKITVRMASGQLPDFGGANPFAGLKKAQIDMDQLKWEDDLLIDQKSKTLIACCSEEARVEVPASVENIAQGAFSHCTQLESVILPMSMDKIKEYTFENCPKLKEIHALEGQKGKGVKTLINRLMRQ